MKNILIFLGSPRKNGNTEQLANAFSMGAHEAGHRCEMIRLSALTIRPCRACGACWTNSRPCIQRDEMTDIYPKIDEANVLVFASPVYYYSWSAQIKTLFDRFFPYAHQNAERLTKKETVLLTAAEENDPTVFDGIRASYFACAQYLEWQNIGAVFAHNSGIPGAVADSGDWLEQAKKLGASL